jgi:hypothetical protein
MSEARDVMDRLTEAVLAHDLEGVAACYAEDAVGVTPDQGEIRGRDALAAYQRQLGDAFPDMGYEPVAKHEAGSVAIDEGDFVGTNTGPLPTPGGNLPPTGRSIRVRSCDVATIERGVIVEHHFYFDQLDFLSQLGLLPDLPS